MQLNCDTFRHTIVILKPAIYNFSVIEFNATYCHDYNFKVLENIVYSMLSVIYIIINILTYSYVIIVLICDLCVLYVSKMYIIVSHVFQSLVLNMFYRIVVLCVKMYKYI